MFLAELSERGLNKPLLQDTEVMRTDALEVDARSFADIGVNGDAYGFEVLAIGIGFQRELGSFRERIRHFNKTAV